MSFGEEFLEPSHGKKKDEEKQLLEQRRDELEAAKKEAELEAAKREADWSQCAAEASREQPFSMFQVVYTPNQLLQSVQHSSDPCPSSPPLSPSSELSCSFSSSSHYGISKFYQQKRKEPESYSGVVATREQKSSVEISQALLSESVIELALPEDIFPNYVRDGKHKNAVIFHNQDREVAHILYIKQECEVKTLKQENKIAIVVSNLQHLCTDQPVEPRKESAEPFEQRTPFVLTYNYAKRYTIKPMPSLLWLPEDGRLIKNKIYLDLDKESNKCIWLSSDGVKCEFALSGEAAQIVSDLQNFGLQDPISRQNLFSVLVEKKAIWQLSEDRKVIYVDEISGQCILWGFAAKPMPDLVLLEGEKQFQVNIIYLDQASNKCFWLDSGGVLQEFNFPKQKINFSQSNLPDNLNNRAFRQNIFSVLVKAEAIWQLPQDKKVIYVDERSGERICWGFDSGQLEPDSQQQIVLDLEEKTKLPGIQNYISNAELKDDSILDCLVRLGHILPPHEISFFDGILGSGYVPIKTGFINRIKEEAVSSEGARPYLQDILSGVIDKINKQPGYNYPSNETDSTILQWRSDDFLGLSSRASVKIVPDEGIFSDDEAIEDDVVYLYLPQEKDKAPRYVFRNREAKAVQKGLIEGTNISSFFSPSFKDSIIKKISKKGYRFNKAKEISFEPIFAPPHENVALKENVIYLYLGKEEGESYCIFRGSNEGEEERTYCAFFNPLFQLQLLLGLQEDQNAKPQRIDIEDISLQSLLDEKITASVLVYMSRKNHFLSSYKQDIDKLALFLSDESKSSPDSVRVYFKGQRLGITLLFGKALKQRMKNSPYFNKNWNKKQKIAFAKDFARNLFRLILSGLWPIEREKSYIEDERPLSKDEKSLIVCTENEDEIRLVDAIMLESNAQIWPKEKGKGKQSGGEEEQQGEVDWFKVDQEEKARAKAALELRPDKIKQYGSFINVDRIIPHTIDDPLALFRMSKLVRGVGIDDSNFFSSFAQTYDALCRKFPKSEKAFNSAAIQQAFGELVKDKDITIQDILDYFCSEKPQYNRDCEEAINQIRQPKRQLSDNAKLARFLILRAIRPAISLSPEDSDKKKYFTNDELDLIILDAGLAIKAKDAIGSKLVKNLCDEKSVSKKYSNLKLIAKHRCQHVLAAVMKHHIGDWLHKAKGSIDYNRGINEFRLFIELCLASQSSDVPDDGSVSDDRSVASRSLDVPDARSVLAEMCVNILYQEYGEDACKDIILHTATYFDLFPKLIQAGCFPLFTKSLSDVVEVPKSKPMPLQPEIRRKEQEKQKKKDEMLPKEKEEKAGEEEIMLLEEEEEEEVAGEQEIMLPKKQGEEKAAEEEKIERKEEGSVAGLPSWFYYLMVEISRDPRFLERYEPYLERIRPYMKEDESFSLLHCYINRVIKLGKLEYNFELIFYNDNGKPDIPEKDQNKIYVNKQGNCFFLGGDGKVKTIDLNKALNLKKSDLLSLEAKIKGQKNVESKSFKTRVVDVVLKKGPKRQKTVHEQQRDVLEQVDYLLQGFSSLDKKSLSNPSDPKLNVNILLNKKVSNKDVLKHLIDSLEDLIYVGAKGQNDPFPKQEFTQSLSLEKEQKEKFREPTHTVCHLFSMLFDILKYQPNSFYRVFDELARAGVDISREHLIAYIVETLLIFPMEGNIAALQNFYSLLLQTKEQHLFDNAFWKVLDLNPAYIFEANQEKNKLNTGIYGLISQILKSSKVSDKSEIKVEEKENEKEKEEEEKEKEDTSSVLKLFFSQVDAKHKKQFLYGEITDFLEDRRLCQDLNITSDIPPIVTLINRLAQSQSTLSSVGLLQFFTTSLELEEDKVIDLLARVSFFIESTKLHQDIKVNVCKQYLAKIPKVTEKVEDIRAQQHPIVHKERHIIKQIQSADNVRNHNFFSEFLQAQGFFIISNMDGLSAVEKQLWEHASISVFKKILKGEIKPSNEGSKEGFQTNSYYFLVEFARVFPNYFFGEIEGFKDHEQLAHEKDQLLQRLALAEKPDVDAYMDVAERLLGARQEDSIDPDYAAIIEVQVQACQKLNIIDDQYRFHIDVIQRAIKKNSELELNPVLDVTSALELCFKNEDLGLFNYFYKNFYQEQPTLSCETLNIKILRAFLPESRGWFSSLPSYSWWSSSSGHEKLSSDNYREKVEMIFKLLPLYCNVIADDEEKNFELDALRDLLIALREVSESKQEMRSLSSGDMSPQPFFNAPDYLHNCIGRLKVLGSGQEEGSPYKLLLGLISEVFSEHISEEDRKLILAVLKVEQKNKNGLGEAKEEEKEEEEEEKKEVIPVPSSSSSLPGKGKRVVQQGEPFEPPTPQPPVSASSLPELELSPQQKIDAALKLKANADESLEAPYFLDQLLTENKVYGNSEKQDEWLLPIINTFKNLLVREDAGFTDVEEGTHLNINACRFFIDFTMSCHFGKLYFSGNIHRKPEITRKIENEKAKLLELFAKYNQAGDGYITRAEYEAVQKVLAPLESSLVNEPLPSVSGGKLQVPEPPAPPPRKKKPLADELVGGGVQSEVQILAPGSGEEDDELGGGKGTGGGSNFKEDQEYNGNFLDEEKDPFFSDVPEVTPGSGTNVVSAVVSAFSAVFKTPPPPPPELKLDDTTSNKEVEGEETEDQEEVTFN